MSEYIVDVNCGYFGLGCEPYESVVRCRDCRYYEPEAYEHISCEFLFRYVEPDCFCAWGEVVSE